MAQITALEPLPGGKHRCAVMVDGDTLCEVDQEIVSRLKLRTGQEVEARMLKQILEHEMEIKARELCFRWLTTRARSRQELSLRLAQRGVEARIATRVLNRFQSVGLINDEAYARAFVSRRGAALGQQRLQAELTHRGIGRELAVQATEEQTPEEERQRCLELAEKKVNIYKKLPLEIARRRLSGFLARRGFSGEDVYQAVKKVLPLE